MERCIINECDMISITLHTYFFDAGISLHITLVYRVYDKQRTWNILAKDNNQGLLSHSP